jgi:hypothetical protein
VIISYANALTKIKIVTDINEYGNGIPTDADEVAGCFVPASDSTGLVVGLGTDVAVSVAGDDVSCLDDVVVVVVVAVVVVVVVVVVAAGICSSVTATAHSPPTF